MAIASEIAAGKLGRQTEGNPTVADTINSSQSAALHLPTYDNAWDSGWQRGRQRGCLGEATLPSAALSGPCGRNN